MTDSIERQRHAAEISRRLGIALDSDEVRMVESWLSIALVEEAEIPPLDDNGCADATQIIFRAGQMSVLNRIRNKRAALEQPPHPL